MKDILSMMKETEAFLEGHFLLSSGKHSAGYCQCARLLQYPDMAAAAIKAIADKVRDKGITTVCGPAMGGIIVSYELARQLGVKSIFTERKDEQMQLRRGFSVDENDVILIAEDVITTGKSTMETVAVLLEKGATVIGAGCIVDRRSPDCDFALPVFSAIQLFIPAYESKNCPLCKDGSLQLNKPGSRQQF